MADDGMLLNFAIDDNFVKPEPKLKGGTWRDRLSAKKIALHRKNNPRKAGDSDNNNDNRSAAQNPNEVQIGALRAPKRQKTDGDFTPHDADERRNQPPQQPRQFISSLFSKNPEPVNADGAAAEGNSGAVADAKPTNAPLIDGLDTFTNLGLAPTLAAHLLTKMELKSPTSIQKTSISQLLKEENDAFIQAETGSGKTLAYLLPLVQRIMALSSQGGKTGGDTNGDAGENGVHRDSGLFAIVLAPTRELCKQISVVLDNLLRCAHWIVAGTVIGGEKKKSEKARLRKGLNILVATPGRLADHLENTQVLDVSNVRWLVLDEGDRLMDLGFEKDLQEIVKALDARQRPSRIPGVPSKRTTVLCSATLKMNVQKLGEISLKDAEHIKSDPADEDEAGDAGKDNDSAFKVPAQLKQSYVVVPAKLRLVTLTAYLKRTFMRKGSVMKAIVFTSCADSVNFHFETFKRQHQQPHPAEEDEEKPSDSETPDQHKSQSPHGTIATAPAFSNPSSEHARSSTLASFSRNHKPSVLLCTDVASRGLDLPNVDLVIEYDPAFSADDHLHRIGRTARLGRDGRALIFLLPGCEENYVEVLKRAYRDGGKALVRTDATEILKRGFGGNIETAARSAEWEIKATDWQLEVERWALEKPEVLEMARRAFQSHVRAYATHVAAERAIFNIKELHLGHLAKSFALRDRPSKVNVPGLRQGAEETKRNFKSDKKSAAAGRKRKAGANNHDGDDAAAVSTATDAATAAQKMKAKMKEHMAGASEFNLA
ncbi:hypothetical protein PHISP_06055 [Aspergillus sp. HF37]|nr:hypothetical protein PHISP_06055 [Aspergillus sp. HF37]